MIRGIHYFSTELKTKIDVIPRGCFKLIVPGRVIMNLFRLLHAVRHGMEALVYSNHPRKLRSQCNTRINAGTCVGCGSLK